MGFDLCGNLGYKCSLEYNPLTIVDWLLTLIRVYWYLFLCFTAYYVSLVRFTLCRLLVLWWCLFSFLTFVTFRYSGDSCDWTIPYFNVIATRWLCTFESFLSITLTYWSLPRIVIVLFVPVLGSKYICLLLIKYIVHRLPNAIFLPMLYDTLLDFTKFANLPLYFHLFIIKVFYFVIQYTVKNFRINFWRKLASYRNQEISSNLANNKFFLKAYFSSTTRTKNYKK